MNSLRKSDSPLIFASRKVQTFVACACLLVVASCAQLSEDECANLNWHATGLADATAGIPSSEVDRRLSVCGEYSSQAVRSLYDAGYQAGLAEYCSRDNGFEVGKNGDEYLGMCPAIFEAEFLRMEHWSCFVDREGRTSKCRKEKDGRGHI